MPRLSIQSGVEAGRVFPIETEKITLGRSVNNDLQIVDRRMSRNHAEVFQQNGAFFVRDLGSKNGTLHNGAPLTGPIMLNGGDIVTLGDTSLVFEDETTHGGGDSDSTVLAMEQRRRHESSTGAYRLVDEHQWGSTQGQIQAGIPDATGFAIPAGADQTSRELSRRLEILYKVTEAIRSVFAIDELLEQIMEIINDVIKPDRAYLLLSDSESGNLIPEVIKDHKDNDESREVKVSTSIVERCMNESVSLLVSDAAQDDRFSASESIIVNRIRTAMAAPLLYKKEKLGVVYVDTNTRMVPFTQEELELLTGITNQAAVAISNARLHSQLVEQHKLAREMEIARTIQMNLLPKVYPDLAGYDVSAMSLPAKQVGGDYYDFIHLPDGRVGFAVADVSGKGVPAAILTATTRSYLQSETQIPNTSIVDTVERINHLVFRDVTNDMYVTMALVYLEKESGEVEYVNAGHCHPFVMGPGEDARYLEKGGLFLGIMSDVDYEPDTFVLEAGQVLVLYTDGVTDIQDDKGDVFGTDRFLRLVRENLHQSAEQIRNAIYQDCLRHRGEADQFDDFTVIIVKRNPTVDTSLDELDFD